jgi:hypothetical protein
MVAGLFQPQLPGGGGETSQNTDDELLAAAKLKTTVGTAKPIKGFIRATKADVERERDALKQRREQSACFKQLLAINLRWQETDYSDTKALTSWRTATTRNLMRKNLVVARGAARQEILGAQFTQRVKSLQEATTEKINELQQRKDRAKQRVQQPR